MMGHEAELTDPFELIGTIVERKFRVDRVVAEGGFGVVYAGHHLALDVPVAVKVLRPRGGGDPAEWADAVARFLLEAKAIARLRHPAVVGVLDSGVLTTERFAHAVPWIVLEWIDGETLAAHLAARRGEGGRSPTETLALLRPVFEAIAAAHDAGVAHRDLKPGNIMLARTPGGARARVLDFGIAKLSQGEMRPAGGATMTTTDQRAFSPVCAAPEQVSGTRTGPWTDVYGLALLATEVLTDAPPYPPDDAVTALSAVFDPRRPTPARVGIDVGAWEPVLARALAVGVIERHGDARELLVDLERALPGATHRVASGRARIETDAPPPATRDATTRLEPGSRRARSARTSWLAALGLAAAVGAVGVARARAPSAPARAPAAPAACTSNRACSAGGVPSVCSAATGACVPLASVDCQVMADAPALERDDTVWIGSMFPLSGADADDFGRANGKAVDLARRDFVQAMSGVHDARPFGVLSCDDAADPRRAAAHLVDVGAAAVIGFRSGADAIDLSETAFVPNHVLSVCATSTNPLVTRVPQPADEPRLVWRTTYEFGGTVEALSAFVARVLEPAAVARGELAPGEGLRVALVRPKNALQSVLTDAVARTLRVGGRSVAEDPRAFRDLAFDPGASQVAPEYARVAGELVAFAPHVVLFSGPSDAVREVLAPVERQWPSSRRARPAYASIAPISQALVDFVGSDAGLRRRVFGVSIASGGAAHVAFVARYAEAYPDDAISSTDAPDTAYDAFYLLAYAAYALPASERATGPALSRAFAQLAGGRRVEAGMAGIFDAYGALAAGRAIDLVGATGSMHLDPSTGEAPLDEAILCVAADAAGRATRGIESGLSYSPATRALSGKMRCP
jgi:hypothetical protein